ncbi:MAG: ABC transporter substrate-binding protein [Desulfopila sp.]
MNGYNIFAGKKEIMGKKNFFDRFVVMLLLVVLCLAGCSPSAERENTTRTVTDSEGVEIEVAADITKAAPAIGAFAQMTEIVAGPGKIAAAATKSISATFTNVFPDYLKSNPDGYDARSVEGLIASGAQVVYGPSSVLSDEQKDQLAAAGIPFVAINAIKSVAGMCASFMIIGDIFGEQGLERAKNFVTYYRGNIQRAKELTASVGDADKVSIICLRHSGGAYSTINGKDICNEYFEAAGGINVAKNYTARSAGTGLTVNQEQIVTWNPAVIMAFTQSAQKAILADPALAQVDAVKNRQVYVCPYGVYNWSVRSGEGAMLPLWLGTIMYPDRFADIDMAQVVKGFFNDYYAYAISDKEIATVLAGSAN